MGFQQRKALVINERLRIDFTMNKDGDNFFASDFGTAFRVIMGTLGHRPENSWN